MKIAYTDFWGDFNPSTFPLTQIIQQIEGMQQTNSLKDTDFLLYSCMGSNHFFAPDNVVKIYYTGENLTPDFNACDYAIGFDRLEFGDRYLRFPLYYLYDEICEKMEGKHILPIEETFAQKTDFCSMTISNSLRNPIYKKLFAGLSAYKHVDSGGKCENNIGGPVKDKFSFDYSHKFSIVCENSAYPGYTTEKIVQAFAANCIPIYWGDPTIGEVFNKKAFVNVQDFDSVGSVFNRVKEIDKNADLYVEMLQTPALADIKYSKGRQMEILKSFLLNIFTLPIEQAMRRNRDCQGNIYIQERQYQIRKSNGTNALSSIKGLITRYF